MQQHLGAGSWRAIPEWAGLQHVQQLLLTRRFLPYIQVHRRTSLPARHFLHLQQRCHVLELACYRKGGQECEDAGSSISWFFGRTLFMVPLRTILEEKGPGLTTDLLFFARKSLSYLPVKSCHSEAPT